MRVNSASVLRKLGAFCLLGASIQTALYAPNKAEDSGVSDPSQIWQEQKALSAKQQDSRIRKHILSGKQKNSNIRQRILGGKPLSELMANHWAVLMVEEIERYLTKTLMKFERYKVKVTAEASKMGREPDKELKVYTQGLVDLFVDDLKPLAHLYYKHYKPKGQSGSVIAQKVYRVLMGVDESTPEDLADL